MGCKVMTEVTCRHCGWVHFQVSRMAAEQEIAHAEQWLSKLSPEKRADYGATPTIVGYERCASCGGSYKNFRDAKPDDAPRGCTLQPIVDRSE